MKIKLPGGVVVEREDKRNARAQGKSQAPAKRGRKPKAKPAEPVTHQEDSAQPED